jgi:hypothetical protein
MLRVASVWAMPMPADSETFEVGVSDNSGASSLSFPIPAPPGTAGFVPNLALTYSSQAGDGPFGSGWNLQFGDIRRSFRLGVPAFDDAVDQFELGSELLVRNTAASTATRIRYHTQTESFSRILHILEGGRDIWEVTRPDGTILRFGVDASTTASAPRVLRDGASGPILRWLLTEMESPDGNVIQFDHLVENGADYPTKVRYTYRDVPRVAVGAVRTIEFVYETRGDQSLTFMGGVSREITRRVNEITIKVGTTVYRKLDLVYAGQTGAGKTYSTTNRSRLAQIKVFGSGGTQSLPPQKFVYADPVDVVPSGSAWTAASFTIPPGLTTLEGPNPGIRFAELNGDGRVDLVQAHQSSSGVLTHRAYLNSGSGWVLSQSWSNALALDAPYLQTAGRKVRYTAQASGAEYALASASTLPAANPVVFYSGVPELTNPTPGAPLTFDYTLHRPWTLADINGDARADLIYAAEMPIPFRQPTCSANVLPRVFVREVWLNNGAGWTRDATLSSQLPSLLRVGLACTDTDPGRFVYPAGRPEVSDINGDDKLDFIDLDTNDSGGRNVFLRASAGWTLAAGPGFFGSFVAFADLNRDGLSDAVSFYNSRYEVWLNTGTGWCRSGSGAACSVFGSRYALPNTVGQKQLVDLNGDGYLDLLQLGPTTVAAWLHEPGGVAVQRRLPAP